VRGAARNGRPYRDDQPAPKQIDLVTKIPEEPLSWIYILLTGNGPKANMNSPASNSKTHMPQLDALRAFAVAGVAFFHWTPEKYHYGIPLWSGVPLFFVLSGFLISSILLQCRHGDLWFAMKAFYARRFLRIFPLFYLTIFAAYVLNIPPMRETFLWHVSYLSNFYLFFRQGWDGRVSHFWTLAVEEQFYLFWPLVILFAPKHQLLNWVLALCATGALSILVVPFFSDAKLLGVLPNFNFFALGLGSLLALRDMHPRIVQRFAVFSVYAIILFLILNSLVKLGFSSYGMGELSYLALVVSFFGLIYKASIGFGGWIGKCLTRPSILYLGRISYGLYVLHLFADFPADLFCRKVLGISSSTLSFSQTLALKAIFTVLGAIVSWHCIEKPINSLKSFFPYRKKDCVDPDHAS
jgi:peptidoglycan/LPS O-acetylase OafA/YrhL